MLFNSYDYLLWFLPGTLVVFFLLGRRPFAAQVWLTVASLFFYGWWNPWHLPLILGSIAFNFGIARLLQRRAARAVLALGVAVNLAVLGVFKYADFFLANAAHVVGDAPPLLHLALPLGISFFTFTQIAYLVDVYRRKAQEPVLANYALFVTFFPQLIAGPIVHHSEMMPQFADGSNKRAAVGQHRRRLVPADDRPREESPHRGHLRSDRRLRVWRADDVDGIGGMVCRCLAYTLQIYFDFSGYSDMAIGAARLFNIRLPINFNSPYRATDIPTSGTAGTSRSPDSCANTSTSRWAATAAVTPVPRRTSSPRSFWAACGTAPPGRS